MLAKRWFRCSGAVLVWGMSSALFWVGASPRAVAQEVPITLEKRAGEADPVVAVRGGGGSADLVENLRRVLTFSGWFRVEAGSGGGVDYVIEPDLESGSPDTLSLVVRSSGGGFRLRTRGRGGMDMLCRAAVDRLIRELFDRPGPCMSLIAFVNGGATKEVSLIHPDGRGARTLTRNGTISTEPNWGGSAGHMVYTLYRNHRSETILMDVPAGRQRRIARQTGLNAGAALSPDGGWLAVCLSKGDQVDLFLSRVGAGERRRLTSDTAVEASPAWAPDGRALCYVSDRFGTPQVHVLDRLGGGAGRRLLSQSVEAVSPDWSPDGKRIVFAMRQGGRYRIAYVELGTGGQSAPVIVTDASSDWESPAWAPDSRHVVCSRENGSQRSICVVDTRDGSVQPLTRRGNYALPDWSDPLPLR